jgi:hypothetical protein
LCLVIIFIAHVFDNPWAALIPARFGFSDATEIFVFCSGMASAIAFGGTFRTHGMWTGSARILFRCWQVYWSHIALFLVATALMIAIDAAHGSGHGYVEGLGLAPLLDARAAQAVLGLVTLRWVPNYFDILPMYLVILLMVPVVVGLSRIDLRYVTGFIAALWVIAQTGWLKLPAEPWSPREWFFNPFAWQLLFFTGFAFMSGWLPAPPADRRLGIAAATFAVLSIPFAWAPMFETVPVLDACRTALGGLIDKTNFGAFRYLHFLSLAYLAYLAAGEAGRNLTIFMSGLVLAFAASAALTLLGRSFLAVAVVNTAGIVLLVVIARVVTYFKSAPWSRSGAPKVSDADRQSAQGQASSRPALETAT